MNVRYFRLLGWFMMSCICMMSKADDGADRMILHYKDGTNFEIQLREMPVIKFEEGELCLNSASTNIKCPLENISYYLFAGISMGVESVTLPGISFVREGDIIKIYSQNKDTNIDIFDLQGFRLNVDTVYSNDCHVVNIGTLTQGVYVISINGHAIKFIRE